ncbi:MAG: methyltransferase domain-containing protein [Alphaproteobacteria bacterium]|nr:methyltransferase domain-containing protein [Alphaproteobacteria bacterium]
MVTGYGPRLQGVRELFMPPLTKNMAHEVRQTANITESTSSLWHHIKDDRSLLSLGHAHMLSSALFAALELGVFDKLHKSQGLSPSALAAALDCPAENIQRLLVVCHALGLLNENDGLYKNSELADHRLVACAPHSYVPVLLHQKKHVYPAFDNLIQAIQATGSTSAFPGKSIYDRLNASERDIFIRSLNFYATGVGKLIAETVDLTSINHMTDIGCGGGQVALELLTAAPHLCMTLVDGSETISYIQSCQNMLPFRDRIDCLTADILKPWVDEVYVTDAVMLSSVLGDWHTTARKQILHNANTLLKKDGMLLISETLVDENQENALRSGIISLYVLTLTNGGNNYTQTAWRDELRQSGFEIENVHFFANLGKRDLIVARKINELSLI